MKKLKLALLLLPLVFVFSACSVSFKSQSTVSNDIGGVFVSVNKGENFRQMSVIPSVSGAPGSMNMIDTNYLVMDPSDSGAVYLASFDDGLYYTYNAAKGWFYVNTLPNETINDLAVDPKDKCTIYAAIGSKLYKSEDCARFWKEVYFDNNPSVQVTSVAVDHYDNNGVYIGTSRGEVIKSSDRGQSWRTIQRLNDGVKKVMVSPTDSRFVFVASAKNGIYRFNYNSAMNLEELADYKNTFDGTNWTDLNSELKEFNLGFNFKGLAFCPADGSIFLATDKVLLKTLDNGESWAKIKLITPEKETFINSIAVNPKNSKEIFYVTNTLFFKSLDGGETWITKQLPTARAGWSMVIDFNNPDIIYLGVNKIKQE